MIDGHWYPKGSALCLHATLTVNDLGRYAIEVEDGTIFRGDVSFLSISARLGNIERKITLENDSTFTTLDNNAIDLLFKDTEKVNAFIHHLETHGKSIFMALIITFFTGFSFFKWGVPYISKKIAHVLPYQTNELISAGSMTFLDKYLFDESNITKDKQDKIREHFKKVLAPLSFNDDTNLHYKIHFRSWEMDGEKIPNALALPSGDIILTDQFIELSSNQEEIDSVILHEMGHVVHRHSLEMLIEGTFITVAVMMISGDGSGVGDMGVGLGSALISSSYSRRHESEADVYAFNKMLIAKIDPASFSAIMNRMTEYMNMNDNDMNKTLNDSEIMDYFSSHPNTKERVKLANHYSECFKEGLTVCK